MERTAKVFRNKRSQLVRLPKGFQFEDGEVLLERRGDEVVLSLRRKDWRLWLDSGLAASRHFLPGVGFPAMDEGSR